MKTKEIVERRTVDDLIFVIVNVSFLSACIIVMSVWLSYDKHECPASGI
jgi:hypothetical protein